MLKKLKKYQGLLGINARNLKYIRPYNRREAVKLADSKLKTKHYLSARNIPVPRLFGVIKSHDEIANFDFGSLPQNIVLKPNRGLGGEGIIAFKSRKGKNFTTVGGRKISLEEIKAHITDIVDGRYSINNTPDIAFFEQRIINHPDLEKYSYKGLPDIRIIVYNLVPVMAMLRLPTRQSEGKANLAQGAVGVGIDLSTGKPTYISLKNKIVKEIPGAGKFDKDFRLPFFDEMLLIASKCQIITNLGYLACDIALDETNGPILLEVNARAGLKVQLANKAPLQKRLEQLRDIKVSTPEKGVRIAKDLFGKRENIVVTKQSEKIHTIGLEEIIELILPNEKIVLKAKIDPEQEESIIDRAFQDKLENVNRNQARVKITLSDKRLQTIVRFKKLKTEHDMIIGKRDIKNFLIDVNKKLESSTKSKLPKEAEKTKKKSYLYVPKINFGQLDHEISNIAKQIKMIKRITPSNLYEEMAKFDKDKTYNPQFTYETDEELIVDLLKAIENIKTDRSPLGTIFEDKRKELYNMIRMIEHVGTSDFKIYAKKLFPAIKKQEIEVAKNYLKNQVKYAQKNEKMMTAKQAAKFFESKLKQYELKDWKVELKDKMVSECSVNKSNRLFIKSTAKFSEWRLNKLVAHEIETHILTAENGKKQPYALFQNGTANYLETQEGLAIYNQELALGIHPKNYFASHTFIGTDICFKNSFVDAFNILVNNYKFTETRAKTLCLKTKRGLHDTGETGGIAKQAIYFRGALKIDKFVKNGGDLKELYVGKISIDELNNIKKIASLNPPVHLPIWY